MFVSVTRSLEILARKNAPTCADDDMMLTPGALKVLQHKWGKKTGDDHHYTEQDLRFIYILTHLPKHANTQRVAGVHHGARNAHVCNV